MATATANTTGTVTAKRKPVFTKVDQLKPGTNGHTLTVKVLSSQTVKATGKTAGRSSSMLMARPQQPTRIAECVVGDETGTIVFTARNEQGKMLFILCVCFSLLVVLMGFRLFTLCIQENSLKTLVYESIRNWNYLLGF